MRFTKDLQGLPGIWADDDVGALFGLGLLHGLHRPLQSLLLPHAGAGRLMARLVPAAPLRHLDTTAHRLDLPRRGAHTARSLSPWARERVLSYLAGMQEGLRRARPGFATRQIVRLLGVPSPEDLCSGFLLSSYLGLSEGQERMERLLVEALGRGADPRLLESMFAPHLAGWDPESLAELPRHRPGPGFAAHSLAAVGGSNAWAVSGAHSASGHPLLAGDPHLQINQMPALFYEVRVRLPKDYWIGASIPGLPGLAVGRNRHLAWSGTFSVADNVDHFVAPKPLGEHTVREAAIRQRFLPALKLRWLETERGTLDPDGALSTAWSGPDEAWQAMQAYLRLPSCHSAAEADAVLGEAHTLSLHFVLADRGGAVRYRQVGRIPRRSDGWSGLWPAPVGGPKWQGSFRAAELPGFEPEDGIVVSANEARPGPGGVTLSTLAQPRYRQDRIMARLAERRDHDLASMQAIQQDLYSGQVARLRPALLSALPEGPLKRALAAWDGAYHPHQRGPEAFALVYRAALSALASDLGGPWFEYALSHSEVSVWWAEALDRTIAQLVTWPADRKQVLAQRLEAIAGAQPRPWAQVQSLNMPHLVFGGLPDVLGYDRGPYPLAGSVGTVCQGNLLHLGEAEVAVGPAYRFVCDLGDEGAQSSLPGGVDGDPASDSYDGLLEAHLAGRYHALVPPNDQEATWFTVHRG